MGALYPGTSVSGYNSNPPPDDGSTGSNNLITWSGIKTKLGDPLDNFAVSVDSNITGAFGKTVDGSGIVSTGISYNVVAGDQGKLIKATASGITITTPATSVGTPFMFAVNNQSTGTITLAGASANVDGAASQVIQSGGGCIVKFDGTNWFTFGLQAAQPSTNGSQHGFDAAVNIQLNASVGSNILTVALKTKAGNDPSAGDPVLIPFRDSTQANGGPIWVTITSALSITTNAVGATLGTANTVPFRLWVGIFNNSGTPFLALYQTVSGGASPTNVASWNEAIPISTTAISAAATNAATWYTPNGTTLTSKSFRVLGYMDWSAGLTTAGTYASGPTTIQLFGPGIKKPGDVIQTAAGTSTAQVTSTSATKVQANPSVPITPTATPNLIKAACISGGVAMTTNSGSAQSAISRGTSFTALSLGSVATIQNGGNSSTFGAPITLMGIDAPGTVSSTTYVPFVWNPSASGTTTWNATTDSCTPNSYLEVSEIMV